MKKVEDKDMRKNILKAVLSLAVVASVLFGNTGVAYADNQEVQGSTDDSRAVEITCSITSVYSVSLPASIALAYDTLEDVYVGDALQASAEGYWGTIIFGCAGKISSSESVFIEPVFPCTMTGTSGATVTLKKVLPNDKTEPKTSWSATEIGTADFDGTSLSNCTYAYNTGLRVGFLSSDATTYETYRGTLTFNFGIRAN